MDNKFLDKLMEKKKAEGPMDENQKSAKMSMLKALHEEMSKMMSDDLKNGAMKKVEVDAPDAAGLKSGLEKAKEMLSGGASDDSDDNEAEEDEPAADEASEDMLSDLMDKDGSEEALTPEKCDELIAMLEKKKAEAMMKG